MTTLYANPKHLSQYHAGQRRCRWDYDSPDHILSEMMNETYFSSVLKDLREGDYIRITDGAMEMVEIRIDIINKRTRKVAFSVVDKLKTKVITKVDEAYDPRWSIRFRGFRGGHWCVIDKANNIVANNYISKEDAERVMKGMMESNGEIEIPESHRIGLTYWDEKEPKEPKVKKVKLTPKGTPYEKYKEEETV